MASKLFRDISASTIQVAVNQLAGVAVFLLTSLYLPKEVFGELSWAIAVMTFATTVLSLRLEQVLVRKAAANENVSVTMTLFWWHVFFSGLVLWLVLFLLSWLFPAFFSIHYLLMMIGVSQLISFFSSPFKQVANGKEHFGFLAIMSSISNIVRAVGLLILVLFFTVTPKGVVLIFITGSVAELLLSYYLVSARMNIQLARGVGLKDYSKLLRESLPQIGSAILIAGISRMDWILLGIFSTSIFTAEYSFAYRVYELSPVPLLIIAPVLLSRFSKFFATKNENSLPIKAEKIKSLVRVEMVFATFIPLLLNILWIPVLEPLSHGKYGVSNASVFMVLSFCTPFQYMSNLLWTSLFAQNKLKKILQVTVITFLVILIGDVVFIPLYGTIGAAFVYLTAMAVEYINYRRCSSLPGSRGSWFPLLVCTIIAAATGFTVMHFLNSVLLQLLIATGLYLLLVLATRQLQKSDIRGILRLAKKERVQ